jgi:methylmalonyl-CoA mutase C-terminal domain/subunit
MTLFPAVMQELKKREAGDVIIFGGGIIPEDDELELRQHGVRAIFKPGASTHEIVDFIETVVRPHAAASRLS